MRKPDKMGAPTHRVRKFEKGKSIAPRGFANWRSSCAQWGIGERRKPKENIVDAPISDIRNDLSAEPDWSRSLDYF